MVSKNTISQTNHGIIKVKKILLNLKRAKNPKLHVNLYQMTILQLECSTSMIIEFETALKHTLVKAIKLYSGTKIRKVGA